MEVIKNVRSNRGANLNIKGRAEKILDKTTSSKTFAIKPDDFFGTIPKMLHKEGANLKPPVKRGVNPRRISFAARFAGMKGPMKDKKGRPTRKALALRAWGFRSVESARNFANRHKKKK